MNTHPQLQEVLTEMLVRAAIRKDTVAEKGHDIRIVMLITGAAATVAAAAPNITDTKTEARQPGARPIDTDFFLTPVITTPRKRLAYVFQSRSRPLVGQTRKMWRTRIQLMQK